jgi:hypothetical protein
MNNNEHENEPEEKPEADKDSQSVIARASKVLENTEEVTGHLRQIVDAGLLGVCIVFIAAMLGVPQKQFDTPLTIALVAFAVAIPMLVCGFLFVSNEAKPAPGWLILVSLQIAAWIIESIGGLAVAVGVFAIIAHLSPLAFIVAILICIVIVIFGFSGALIGLLLYGVAQYKKQNKKQVLMEQAPIQQSRE